MNSRRSGESLLRRFARAATAAGLLAAEKDLVRNEDYRRLFREIDENRKQCALSKASAQRRAE